VDKKRKDNLVKVMEVEGAELPADLAEEEEEKKIQESLQYPTPGDASWKKEETQEAQGQAVPPGGLYTPQDRGRPWRDFYVQQCARRYLREIILPVWINQHNRTHRNCGYPNIDEWGRWLCRAIQATGPVDGNWENPTHFLFYAYNRYSPNYQSLNNFLYWTCRINI